MADPANASNYSKLQELQDKLDELNGQSDAYLEEWEALEEELSKENG